MSVSGYFRSCIYPVGSIVEDVNVERDRNSHMTPIQGVMYGAQQAIKAFPLRLANAVITYQVAMAILNSDEQPIVPTSSSPLFTWGYIGVANPVLTQAIIALAFTKFPRAVVDGLSLRPGKNPKVYSAGETAQNRANFNFVPFIGGSIALTLWACASRTSTACHQAAIFIGAFSMFTLTPLTARVWAQTPPGARLPASITAAVVHNLATLTVLNLFRCGEGQ